MSHRWIAGVALLALVGAACQREVQNDLCLVSGKVAFKDQQPYTGGKVAFHSFDEDDKFVLYAPVGADGQYQLRYGKQPGAPAGKYPVVIVPDSPAEASSPPPALHRDFTTHKNSRVVFTISPGENVCNITVWK